MPDVLCVGAVNHDTIALVDRLPRSDERIIAESLEIGFGGPVATAAVALARLGHEVAMSASVGDDAEGTAVIDALESEGVDTSLMIRRVGETTARSVILVERETRERAIVTSPYRSRPERVPLDAAPIIHVDQAGYAIVHGFLAAADPADRPKLSVDHGNPIAGLQLEDIWLYGPTVSMLRIGFGDGDLFELLERARAAGPQIVVASDGARGSGWMDGGDRAQVPAYAVDIVSTLGAGDVFHGALLSALIDGREPSDALRWANACAALSCRGLDGRSAIPTRHELEAFLATEPAFVP